ncbi:DNA mismatch repair protein MutS [Candidatus Brocadiaceae bacterium S225]|uniref:DNA mismatch repair protein MutS n=1 Tax=Candidatus Scalindua brodae TaxID=237368 RepID=A0A0B0EPK6_9BACT|nr:MAG: DNA mismatch repair protein MutS [Candidatus Scalindua brodae]TWU36433.1 DNA mismatch repair protein MutS [Candidatus Brocadiaceae bacterium S225]
MIAPELKNDEALWLLRTLVYHDCTADYHFRGNMGILNKIPPHKSLFKVAKNKGLPIGNLNSQFFANVYLNLLDQFVKHQLKCRYYLRYCDDTVFLSRDREELTMWKDKIETFIDEKLQLELRKSFKLQPVSNGIDFLGYIVRTDYLLVRRRVVNNLHVKLREHKSLLVKEGRFYRRYLFDEEMLDRLHAILSSYLGHFKMANSYNLCKSIWEKHAFLDQYFDFDPEACRLTRKYKYPAGIRRTCQQYFYYRWRFTGDVILFQVGSFFEFYSEHDKKIACNIDLARIRKNRRGVKYGFPVHMINIYIQRLFRYNTFISVILEREQYPGGIKKRAPAYRLERLTKH